MIKYIELKSGYNDNGPAWIARVKTSKTGQTIYFNNMALGKAVGGVAGGNYMSNGDVYWVSGVKKNETNRHWAGSGYILIEESAFEEFKSITGLDNLKKSQYRTCPDFPETSGAQFVHLKNEKLY
tara:strand:- start:462 stop:836 length:375 start_codon:yes stop_codon:yes gene_type:complete